MTNKNLKNKLHQLIDQTDDVALLKKIYAILETLQKSNIVAEPSTAYLVKNKLISARNLTKKNQEENYTKPGKPMSIAMFKKHIKKAQQSLSTSHEDFLKEIELWDRK